MTVIETIVRGVQTLPLREQVEVARYVHRLSASAQSERAAVLDHPRGARRRRRRSFHAGDAGRPTRRGSWLTALLAYPLSKTPFRHEVKPAGLIGN